MRKGPRTCDLEFEAQMSQEAVITNDRATLVRRGGYLEYFTIGYNSLEGLIAVGAGLIADSIALVGFGFDT